MTANAAGLESAWRAAFGRAGEKILHLVLALSPARRRARADWLQRDGVEFLRGIGVRPGDALVDFGCGSGAYSLPAARLVGEKGLVVAVDTSARKLKRLAGRAAAASLDNIRAVQDTGRLKDALATRRCRAILLYDVLHFLDAGSRTRLYGELLPLLPPDGVLSVHPKHVSEDAPRRHFMHVTTDDLIREVTAAGFALGERRQAELWHGFGRCCGVLLNFHPAAAGPVEASAGDVKQSEDKRRGRQA